MLSTSYRSFARIVRFAGVGILCLAALGCTGAPAGTAYAQSAGAPPSSADPCQSPESAPPDLVKQPNYRQVVVSVENRQGAAPPALTKNDLSLHQGNKALPIYFFQSQPATIGILVDTSGSMQPKLPRVTQALAVFVRHLDPRDEVFLGAFSGNLYVLQPPTTDHQAVIDSFKMLHPYGQTALYDAIAEGLRRLPQGCYQGKALLVVTDGMDNASVRGLEETKDQVHTVKVPLYFVGLGNINTVTRKIGSFTFSPMSGDIDTLDTTALSALATAGNGEMFVVSLKDENGLLKALNAIADKIDNYYVLGFIGNGSISQLRIETVRDKGIGVKVGASD